MNKKSIFVVVALILLLVLTQGCTEKSGTKIGNTDNMEHNVHYTNLNTDNVTETIIIVKNDDKTMYIGKVIGLEYNYNVRKHDFIYFSDGMIIPVYGLEDHILQIGKIHSVTVFRIPDSIYGSGFVDDYIDEVTIL